MQKNYLNRPTFDKVTVKIKVAQFFWTHSVVVVKELVTLHNEYMTALSKIQYGPLY